ncbi:arylsulfatase [uncultured Draconibacterium sp.]|uniref:arylsulfatase n=1 Tax=uncultured Draconibacterium sp. TaxID=1573823 RepID=UPI0025E43341|nr:arylsulfatase [uncultured Draconibacterium sp.]
MKSLINVVIFILFCHLCGCSSQKKELSERPNVIIVLADDQGYGDLSCHGNPYLKTPNLDKLHDEAVRFTDFHVSGVCTPSRSQIMTGLDAVRNGAYSFGFGRSMIFEEYTDTLGHRYPIHLMSDFFKANGYSTGHFGKWHLGDTYPYRSMDRGFDETLTFPGASVWQSPSYWNNDCYDDFYYRNGELTQTEGYYTDLWFKETMKFIESTQSEEKPFFIYLPTATMHTPLFVDKEYVERFKDFPAKTAQFYGMIAHFDEKMGEFDQFLEEKGLKENTVLVYMSDNGGTFGCDQFNAGMKGHKGSYYDGGHRAPCFIRWPNGEIQKGLDIDELTLAQDILPTLIDMCRLENPWNANFDGTSLLPAMKGEKQNLSQRKSVVQFNGLEKFAVLWKKWRLVGENELYNVESDTGQENNVIEQFPEVAKLLKDYYKSWKKDVNPSEETFALINVGSEKSKHVLLSCFDWLELEGEGNPSQQYDIRQGRTMHGFWNVDFQTAGTYKLVFRRWPGEADTEINKGLPPYYSHFAIQNNYTETPSREVRHYWSNLSERGIYPIGEALPITQARLTLNEMGIDTTINVSDNDKFVKLELELPKGQTKLQLDFQDEKGNILCGAYYCEIVK